jgi:hypothetical protein
MQEFLEAAKRTAGAAVDRATWEANRMRRASARQHEVDLAQRERSTLLEQIGDMVLDLEGRGQLTDNSLVALCKRLRALNGEIADGQAEVQSIRAETYKPGAGATGPDASGPSGAGGSAGGAAGGSGTGGAARPSTPASPSRAAPPASATRADDPVGDRSHACPSCGKLVRDGAAFCSSCGAPQR